MSEDRARFRLVELVVLILVTAIGGSVLIQVVRHYRRIAADRQLGGNNLRNLAHAIANYELVKRQYPGYVNVWMLNNGHTYRDPETGEKHGVSWVVPLLDYCDQPILMRQWRAPPEGPAKRSYETLDKTLTFLICPADPPTQQRGAPLSYVVNCGMKDIDGIPAADGQPGVPRDWPANGVFLDLYSSDPRVNPTKDRIPMVRMSPRGMKSRDWVPDGASNTIMLSENVDAGQYTDYTEAKVGIVWDANGKLDLSREPPSLAPPDDNMRINIGTGKSAEHDKRPSDDTTFARPSSWHSGGVNMAFCDGHVQFVSEKMDYYVYCLLMSSDGANVRLPGTEKVLPNFDRPLRKEWYSGK